MMFSRFVLFETRRYCWYFWWRQGLRWAVGYGAACSLHPSLLPMSILLLKMFFWCQCAACARRARGGVEALVFRSGSFLCCAHESPRWGWVLIDGTGALGGRKGRAALIFSELLYVLRSNVSCSSFTWRLRSDCVEIFSWARRRSLLVSPERLVRDL